MYFFFNDTATTEIYTLSLHDALPISLMRLEMLDQALQHQQHLGAAGDIGVDGDGDRKSTRLNSSHLAISYTFSCLKTTTTTGCIVSSTTDITGPGRLHDGYVCGTCVN